MTERGFFEIGNGVRSAAVRSPGLLNAAQWLLRRRALLTVLCGAVVCLAATVYAEPPPEGKPRYLRVRALEKKGVEVLEVPVVHYRPKRSTVGCSAVDFIGAVHIADKEFYQEVNRRFTLYDAVLFELVADSKRLAAVTSGSLGKDGAQGLAALQGGMGAILGLSFQLDHVDYNRANLVHADLSPQQLGQRMKDRGENLLTMFLSLMQAVQSEKGLAAAAQLKTLQESMNGISPLKLILQGPTPDERYRVKRFIGNALAVLDGVVEAFQGGGGASLIVDRNAAVIEVLKRECKSAPQRRVAIFYGAAHLPDLDRQLGQQGYVAERYEWLPAWRIAPE